MAELLATGRETHTTAGVGESHRGGAPGTRLCHVLGIQTRPMNLIGHSWSGPPV